MIVPAAMLIYEGAQSLRDRAQDVKDAETHELMEATPTLIQEYQFPGVNIPSYLLGLEVARAALADSPILAKAGINPDDLL